MSPLPQVDFPTINVSAGLPGASPETMASSVATPLERQFGRIAGVTEMTSTSSLGSTSITLQFDLNRNIDAAARDVQAAINAARGQLPANLPNNPRYRKVNPADAPIMMLALTSDVVDRARMYDIAATILQQKLSQVQGVGQVFVGGGRAAGGARGGQSDRAQQQRPGPRGRPRGARDGQRQPAEGRAVRRGPHLVAHDDRPAARAPEYEPLVIRYRNGAALRLADVADVTDSVEDVRTAGLANGKPAVILIIFRQPGANIIETVDGIRAVLPQLQALIPPTITLSRP